MFDSEVKQKIIQIYNNSNEAGYFLRSAKISISTIHLYILLIFLSIGVNRYFERCQIIELSNQIKSFETKLENLKSGNSITTQEHLRVRGY